jgi:adenosylmethionine-8-amino-7-oxononanoate aminotransferase
VEVWDASGKRYLDASGGAAVVGIGHGVERVAAAIQAQLSEIAYTHATQFAGSRLDEYTEALAPLLPVDDARVYPVSGGSDAVEAALKLARCYHLGRGNPERRLILSRWGSYHGNTLGALDATGRRGARAPYETWLGLARHQPVVNEYRCSLAEHPRSCGATHARLLEEVILEAGAENVAAFIAEPIVGATLAAVVPPEDYWPSISEVCRRYGVLLIVDEVMTGFGRTGRWFAADHWSVRPDILVSAKGVCSGYWPMGLLCCTDEVFQAAWRNGFPHGGTFSHSPMGASIALAVLQELVEGDLVEASRRKGDLLRAALADQLAGEEVVGDIRGRGLFVGIELVQDSGTKEPFPRSAGVAGRVADAAAEAGLIVYPCTGCADGTNGDAILLAPPFVISEEQTMEIVELFVKVLSTVKSGLSAAAGMEED